MIIDVIINHSVLVKYNREFNNIGTVLSVGPIRHIYAETGVSLHLPGEGGAVY